IEPVPALRLARTYILVRRPPFQHQYFAEQVFPALLQEQGFSIREKPSGTSGYMDLFIGGPVYTVKFSKEGRSYQLATRFMPHVGEVRGVISEIFVLEMPQG